MINIAQPTIQIANGTRPAILDMHGYGGRDVPIILAITRENFNGSGLSLFYFNFMFYAI